VNRDLIVELDLLRIERPAESEESFAQPSLRVALAQGAPRSWSAPSNPTLRDLMSSAIASTAAESPRASPSRIEYRKLSSIVPSMARTACSVTFPALYAIA
jgi:hypothetical protein